MTRWHGFLALLLLSGCHRSMSEVNPTITFEMVPAEEPVIMLVCDEGATTPVVIVDGVRMEHVDGVAAVVRVVGFDNEWDPIYLNICELKHWVTQ